MTETPDLVLLFDVDNTLLNNDHVERDLREYLSSCLSTQARDRFFEIFEELRQERHRSEDQELKKRIGKE